MSSYPVRLVAAALAGVVVVGGCSRGDSGDTDATPTTSSSGSATSSAAPGLGPEAASPDALPDGFPAAVPILDGQIDAESRDVLGSGGLIWMVTVTDVDPGGADTAERLLRDAGFVQAEDASDWHGGPCQREAQFSKEAAKEPGKNPGKDPAGSDSYVLHLCGNPEGQRYRLEYTINVYPPNNWQLPSLPEMPEMPAPPAPPEMPQMPPAPEEPPAPEPPR
ncbi:hypothetical protein BHQ15_00230 [Mycolicibacillus koreensis]|nr:hypothetical protein BHQ15_00230 [Mycolicibacillus koreensis]